MRYIQTNSYTNTNQISFRKILQYINYNCIVNSLVKKEANYFVFCDFSKGFDKDWRSVLLYEIQVYRITGDLLSCFSNYLRGRRQVLSLKPSLYHIVKYRRECSKVLSLGPLLFIVCINDIADKLVSLSRRFADDSSLNYSNQNALQLQTAIDKDLREMCIWSKKWLMSFNPKNIKRHVLSNSNIKDILISLLMENRWQYFPLINIWVSHLVMTPNGALILSPGL